MKILALDTSGKTASVAITDGGRLLWEKTVYTRLTHSQVILPMVKEALEQSELGFKDLDCIAAANGPGSYTGLRIGIGAIKGICMGEPSLKAAGISTLLGLAYNCAAFDGRVIAVMRARPKIVYVGEVDCKNGIVTPTAKDRVCPEEQAFGSLDTSVKTMLVGDSAEDIKAAWFDKNDNIVTAPKPLLLQKASSICLAAENSPEALTAADRLEVSYLQATKAEKDKAHSDS